MQNGLFPSAPLNCKSPTFHLSSASPLKIFTLPYLAAPSIIGAVALLGWEELSERGYYVLAIPPLPHPTYLVPALLPHSLI